MYFYVKVVLMRVISGERRGLNLYTLEGDNTRPTLDRVKETMFNVINFDIHDKNCLDIFSGSGNLSIEAISRGARMAYMIENDRASVDIINKNIEKSKYQEKVKIFNKDFIIALNSISSEDIKFDYVFLDPPYNGDFYNKTLDYLGENNLLNEEAVIIVEHLKTTEICHEKFNVWKEKSFSKNMLTFLHLNN